MKKKEWIKRYGKKSYQDALRRSREWHKEHPDYGRNYERAYRHKRGEFLWNLKDKPCVDCKGRFHRCQMDFDHKEGVEKVRHLSTMWRESPARILKEAKKCDLVCASCHRLRTWRRANHE